VTGRPYGGALGRSPLEVAGVALALVLFVGAGVLWAAGVVVGSILGSALPGTGGEGIVAMLRSFPDVGDAWEPSIPSALVWSVAVLLVAAFTPLVWRLVRSGMLSDEGARWATTIDLRRAGLLLSDRSLPHAEAEEPTDAA
jgi:hypothetical protein